MIKHVSTGEQKDRNQAQGCPKVAVLQERHDIWSGDGEEGDDTEDGGGYGNKLDVIEGTNDLRFRSVGGELAGYPLVDLFTGLGTMELLGT